jgi:hypothetical protein
MLHIIYSDTYILGNQSIQQRNNLACDPALYLQPDFYIACQTMIGQVGRGNQHISLIYDGKFGMQR